MGNVVIRKMCEDLGKPAQTDGGKYTIDRFLGSIRHGGCMDDRGTVDPTQNWGEASA